MSATYYIQICPTCGRRLEVKIEYLGLEVSCYHCRARFLAESSSRHLSVASSIPQEVNVMTFSIQPLGEGTAVTA